MWQHGVMQPGHHAVQLYARVHPGSLYGRASGLLLPLIQADASTRITHTDVGLAVVPTEPRLLALQGLQVAHQQQRQRNTALACQGQLVIEGAQLTGEDGAIAMGAGVDGEHHAKLPTPAWAQGQDAIGDGWQLLQAWHAHIATLLGDTQGQMLGWSSAE